MKNIKIFILILSLLYGGAVYGYHWDRDDDYYDDSTWWNGDQDWSFDLDEIVVTPDYGDNDNDSDDDWWRGSYGDDGYDEEDDYDYDYDYYDFERDYDKNTEPDDSPERTHEDIQRILEDIARQLGESMNIDIPVVVYLPEGVYHGSFNAIYYNGEIQISPRIDGGLDEQNWPALIYHEYFHSINDKEVGKDEEGKIITIDTDEPKQLTEREIQEAMDKCIEDIPYMLGDETYLEGCIENALDQDYLYKPSNYFENEIDANTAVLDAVDRGDLDITDKYRQETEDAIRQFTDDYERALDYEQRNGLNPDGTKK